ncbi:MAG TPA: hypothetical protein VGM08_03020 [Candidatus Saccharimonadales bacterium]
MLFGQTPPADAVSLNLPRHSYTVGEPVVVTLSNTSGNVLHVANHCPNEPLSVYRVENGGWKALHTTAPAAKCIGEPSDYILPAHSSLSINYAPWQGLFSQPGTYCIYATTGPAAHGSMVKFTVSQ